MKRTHRNVFYLVLVTALLMSLPAFGADIVYVGEDIGGIGVFGRDYSYVIIPDSVGGTPGTDWYKNSFDHSSWSIGETAFGNSGSIGGLFTVPVRTTWPAGTDVYVFKTFTLGQPVAMTAKTAVDNGYDIYLNDVWVSGANAEGYTSHWEYTEFIPASSFKPGLNWIAFHLEDHGGATGWNFALLGDEKGLAAAPLPSTLILVGSNLVGFLMLRIRRKK